tara:strand:- start:4116 stop:4406 length:291 start_codon:yes stop_codon:yes gene_type:complete
MLVKLIKIMKSGRDYSLKQIFVNPSQILYIQEDERFISDLREGAISLDIHQSTGFSKIRLDSNGIYEELTVVGDPEIIQRKIENVIFSTRKQLLRD